MKFYSILIFSPLWIGCLYAIIFTPGGLAETGKSTLVARVTTRQPLYSLQSHSHMLRQLTVAMTMTRKKHKKSKKGWHPNSWKRHDYLCPLLSILPLHCFYPVLLHEPSIVQEVDLQVLPPTCVFGQE